MRLPTKEEIKKMDVLFEEPFGSLPQFKWDETNPREFRLLTLYTGFRAGYLAAKRRLRADG